MFVWVLLTKKYSGFFVPATPFIHVSATTPTTLLSNNNYHSQVDLSSGIRPVEFKSGKCFSLASFEDLRRPHGTIQVKGGDFAC